MKADIWIRIRIPIVIIWIRNPGADNKADNVIFSLQVCPHPNPSWIKTGSWIRIWIPIKMIIWICSPGAETKQRKNDIARQFVSLMID